MVSLLLNALNQSQHQVLRDYDCAVVLTYSLSLYRYMWLSGVKYAVLGGKKAPLFFCCDHIFMGQKYDRNNKNRGVFLPPKLHIEPSSATHAQSLFSCKSHSLVFRYSDAKSRFKA